MPREKLKARVIAYFDRHPKMTSVEIGNHFGKSPEYIRATLKRNNRKLARRSGRHYLDKEEGG